MTEAQTPPRSLFDLPPRIGRYQVESVVGVGGFAVVVRAFDEGLDTDVAIKVLSEAYAFNFDVRERFLNEARLLRRVRSNHVIDVHDVGQLDDGRPFFVMEYAGGGVLESRTGSAKREPDRRSVRRIVEALADGLGALHAIGVVHRDVKPGNLLIVVDDPATKTNETITAGPSLIGDGERIVVGDLGLAKDQSRSSIGPTMLGGTPLYFAPEQGEIGGRISPASDVYSATAVIWHLLTGEPPPPPEQVATRLVGAPPAWQAFIATGMAREPEDRYQSMESWGRAALGVLGATVPDRGSTRDEVGGFELTGMRIATASIATCPYKGLASFQPEDASLFFGRAAIVDELVVRLQRNPVLVVGGASGSGKSSLVRAGLIPSLRSGALPGSQHWAVVLFTPGPDPMAELHRRLSQVQPRVPTLGEIAADPQCLRNVADAQDLAIFVDQFEEVFTLVPDPSTRARFLAALGVLTATKGSRVRLVLALRADFYGACAEDPWLAKAINESQVLVGPMGRAELHEAIEGPAKQVGMRLEDGLVDVILDEAGHDAGALPLIAHALMETWLRRQGNVMTRNGYSAAGGVAGAIAQRAEFVIAHLRPDEVDVARRVLLSLVNPGENGLDTRRRATWAALGDTLAIRAVVEKLAEARLLSVDAETVDVAHEALISTWPRFRRWIDEARDDLRTRDRITAAAADWDHQRRDPDLLLRGTPLASALEWRASLRQPLGDTAEGFLDAAAEARSRELAEEGDRLQRRRRSRRVAFGALATLTVAAMAATAVAFLSLRTARHNERVARDRFARGLATNAATLTSTDPLLSTILAVEATVRTSPPSMEARSALVSSRAQIANARFVPVGSPIAVGDPLTLALTPVGDRLIVGRRDGSVAIWDTKTHELIAELKGPAAGVQKVIVDKSGRWLLAADHIGKVWRWDLHRNLRDEPNGTALVDLGTPVWSIAVAPDGSSFATGAEDGKVRLFDLESGRSLGEPVIANRIEVLTVAYSEEGNILAATGGTGGIVYVVDLATRKQLLPGFKPHDSQVWELLVSERRNMIISASADRTIRVSELSTGKQLPGPYNPPAYPGLWGQGMLLRPDGDLIFGADDGRLRVWPLSGRGKPVTIDTTHGKTITDTSSSADGSVLATLAEDQTVRLWSDSSGHPVDAVLMASDAKLYSVVRDGSALAVGADDGQVRLIDLDTGNVTGTLDGHDGRTFALARLGPGRMVSGDMGGTVRVWDIVRRKVVAITVKPLGAEINSIASSPDGQRIVVTTGQAGKEVVFLDANLSVLHRVTLGAETNDVTFAPDGSTVITSSIEGGKGVLRRWTVDGQPKGSAVSAAKNRIWAVAFSEDGRFFASADDDETVRLWDVNGDRLSPRKSLTLNTLGATDVVFSGSDTLAATAKDGTVRLWDVETGEPLGTGLSFPGGKTIWHMAVGPDGDLLTAGLDGAVRRIDVLNLDVACRIALPSFDSAQRRQYLGDQPLQACRKEAK